MGGRWWSFVVYGLEKKERGFEEGKSAGSTYRPKSDIGSFHGDSDWK